MGQVVFHHPPYVSDPRGSARWMRWPFAEWGADLVLTGHYHIYERIEQDGLTYVVNGLGGGARYAFGDVVVEGSLVRYNANHGAMLVEASGNTLDVRFITIDGEEVDSFTLHGDCE